MRRLITAALAGLLLLTYCVTSSAIELREAMLSLPAGAARSVELPHTWAGSFAGAQADYELGFELPAQPATPWALRIDRLSSAHRIYLNGQLIHAQGEAPDGRTRLRTLPFYLPLAPALLHAGRNELRLELRFGTRAGLSTVIVGPDAELQPRWHHDRRWDTEMPQALNIAGAALGGLMLLVWLRRRQERATGLYGLLWLVASLRNHDYFVVDSPLAPALSDWLYFSAQCSTVGLLGLFAVALSGAAWPRMQRAYLAVLLLAPLAGALASLAFDGLQQVRLVVYPLLMGLCAGAARILWPLLLQQRGIPLAMLLSGSAVAAASGAHDYAYLHGWLPITGFYWVPYVLPFILSSYGAMLLDRLVLGLARYEELSQRLEQRVAERTAELAEANVAKSRFLAIASHDLRQPVAAIGLMVDLAGEQVRRSHPLAEAMLAKAARALAGLDELLRSLLDISRLDATPGTAVLQPVPLQPLFDAIALHEQASAQARGLRLRFRSTDAVALSDRLLLEQMLRNLVANALRYTERGGVLVAVRRHGAGLRLQVWDSGRGIAPEHQRVIFDDFVSRAGVVDGVKGVKGVEGVGLGLAIVRRSAATLGHALGLRSQVGRGSCFWIELPVVVQT